MLPRLIPEQFSLDAISGTIMSNSTSWTLSRIFRFAIENLYRKIIFRLLRFDKSGVQQKIAQEPLTYKSRLSFSRNGFRNLLLFVSCFSGHVCFSNNIFWNLRVFQFLPPIKVLGITTIKTENLNTFAGEMDNKFWPISTLQHSINVLVSNRAVMIRSILPRLLL